MDRKEIRIGNLVRFIKDTSREGGISLIQKNEDNIWFTKLDNDDVGYSCLGLDQYEGIPLTEEWLIKFGFKPLAKDWAFKGVVIHTRKRGFVLRKSVPDIKHVHQLQNLYFSLTGEELTIKELA